MDIAKLLKGYRRGNKLYSVVHGDLFFIGIRRPSDHPIVTQDIRGFTHYFTSDGRWDIANHDCECILFPSKENRDWSTFKVHKKKEKYNFKPFDKVLVRDDNSDSWKIDLFSNINDDIEIYKYTCLNGVWKQCIPYEDNECLLGTTKNPH